MRVDFEPVFEAMADKAVKQSAEFPLNGSSRLIWRTLRRLRSATIRELMEATELPESNVLKRVHLLHKAGYAAIQREQRKGRGSTYQFRVFWLK